MLMLQAQLKSMKVTVQLAAWRWLCNSRVEGNYATHEHEGNCTTNPMGTKLTVQLTSLKVTSQLTSL